MKLVDHVKGTSKFAFFRAGNLWFRTETGLEFPVPAADLEGGATLEAEQKSIALVRWIRKHLESLVAAKAAAA